MSPERKTLAQRIGAECRRGEHLLIEFAAAFADPFTYSVRRNSEVWFGFAWGLPVPIFALAIHYHAAEQAFSMENAAQLLAQHPIYVFFALHPVLFALVFGAFGTMRAHRDQQIAASIAAEERLIDSLSKANERLRELDRLKDEFLANITHELKSPLVTAIGYNERILGEHLGPVTEKQRHGLQVGKRNLERLRMLIEQILEFSRMEAGIVNLHREEFELNALIGSVVESDAIKARDRGMELVVETPKRAIYLNGDRDKLYQVLLNLLDNAIKYSDGGAGKRIKIGAAQENGGWHVSVSDQGPGIPADVLPRLFGRFVQADGSRCRAHDGVGLGLAISRHIVELHGGKVWLESRPGEGTTAHIFLPGAGAVVKLDPMAARKEGVAC